MADPSLAVLTAMITPAVLISGAGTLLMSTSARLGRSTDRVRVLTARFKFLVSEEGQREPLAREEKRMIIEQLPRLTRRTRYIQRSMQAFYLAVTLLVCTSILIGAGSLGKFDTGLVPILLAILGAGGLAYGALLLSYEATLSAITTRQEMRFLEKLGAHYAGLYNEAAEEKAEQNSELRV
ncbi:DUF2721 domain-containing protein [Deinococcus sp. Arct2-2]|uniref:DUF2721 domain-containing protein n=1 Tax=Deinococcus sp. Arct2-2 TaxID=2568653 RepID=UPI0010A2EFE7|nr:DUF2721 domain-containing protein [Deinococcus sp. Arct2-2]THF71387.1 DUF2721 domain-containing protein [Deinococcus sp. Arct2-2]